MNLRIMVLAAFVSLSVYNTLIFVLREMIHLFRNAPFGCKLRYSGQLLITLIMCLMVTEIRREILVVLCRNEFKTEWLLDLLAVGIDGDNDLRTCACS